MTTNSTCGPNGCLIEITGLCNPADTTDVINIHPYWKQMHVTETLQIPDEKPHIEQLNSVEISVNIFRATVIRTPRSFNDLLTPPAVEPNLEGKILTGRKLVVEGQLCQKVTYTAAETEQSVHSAHFYVPFSSFIIVPQEITLTGPTGVETTVDSLNVTFEVNACIEDVRACALDSRHLLKEVTLLLNAVPTQSN